MTDDLLGVLDPIDAIVAELRKYDGWPVDDTKDRQYARDLLEGFPSLDIVDEARAWRAWMMDHEQKKQVKPRARFSNWLRNARGDRRGSAVRGQGAPARGGRTSPRPRGVEQFGEQSSTTLGRW